MSDITNASLLPIPPENAHNRTEPHTPLAVQTVVVQPSSPPPHPLSSRQLAAIPLLLQGHTDTDVAAQIGVRREAISRWRNHHPLFIATLNSHRQLLHSSLIDRYQQLLDRSIHFLEKFQRRTHDSWFEDQVKLSTTLLRSAARRGLLSPTPNPTSPDQILSHLLSQGLPPCPEDSPENDAPPPPANP